MSLCTDSPVMYGFKYTEILKQVQDDTARECTVAFIEHKTSHCHPELVSGSNMDEVHIFH